MPNSTSSVNHKERRPPDMEPIMRLPRSNCKWRARRHLDRRADHLSWPRNRTKRMSEQADDLRELLARRHGTTRWSRGVGSGGVPCPRAEHARIRKPHGIKKAACADLDWCGCTRQIGGRGLNGFGE